LIFENEFNRIKETAKRFFVENIFQRDRESERERERESERESEREILTFIVYVVIFTSNTYIVLHHFDNCLSPPCKKMNLEWANSVICQ